MVARKKTKTKIHIFKYGIICVTEEGVLTNTVRANWVCRSVSVSLRRREEEPAAALRRRRRHSFWELKLNPKPTQFVYRFVRTFILV